MPKGITRIENYKRRADGWWVRLQSRGEKFSKFFKDSDYAGDREATLRAAQRHRRRLLRENPQMSRQENAERTTAKTGDIIGVRRVIQERFGHEYAVWQARWSPKKYTRRVRTFGVDKYGEKEAKRLAIEVRFEGLVKMSKK
jgi:hypothetical protein